jgi:hypothetical protein
MAEKRLSDSNLALFFLAMLQMVAYLGAAITLLGTILWRKLRGIKQEKGPGREYTWYERAGFLVRLGATVLVSSASIMLAAQALHLYRTLPVLAMLPVREQWPFNREDLIDCRCLRTFSTACFLDLAITLD